MKRLPFSLIAVFVLAVDLYTKARVFSFLREEGIHGGRVYWIWGEWFGLARVWNEGVTGGLGSGASPILITALTGVAVLGIVIYLFRGKDLDRWSLVALAMILGGAVGNLYDRIVYRAVRDFLDVYPGLTWFSWLTHWPTFNVADMAIVSGVCMLVFHALFLAGRTGRMEATGNAAT